MSEHEFSGRLDLVERNLQRMRLAIIIIAAFFVYQAIGPLTFGEDEVEVREAVKVRELFVVDENGQTIAYLGAGEDGARLTLDDVAGNRLDATAGTVSLAAWGGTGHVEGLRLQGQGIEAYDVDGRVIGTLARN